jgi:hypothetical protein
VVMISEWLGGHWGRGPCESGDPVSDDGGEAKGEDASSHMVRCLAFEVLELEG